MLWKILQTSYINDRLVEAGQEIELPPRGRDRKSGQPIFHIPGPHWEPRDDEAAALSREVGHVFTGEVPDMVLSMSAEADRKLKEGTAPVIDHEALGAAIAAGMQAGAAAVPAIDHDALGAAIGNAIAQAMPVPAPAPNPLEDPDYQAWLAEKNKKSGGK